MQLYIKQIDGVWDVSQSEVDSSWTVVEVDSSITVEFYKTHLANNENRRIIREEKELLASTDYMSAKIADVLLTGTPEEIESIKSKYSTSLAARIASRVNINEKEKLLADAHPKPV